MRYCKFSTKKVCADYKKSMMVTLLINHTGMKNMPNKFIAIPYWNLLRFKVKDLSESGKQKPWTHFLLKIQILNREWWSHLPMKGKTLGSHSRERIFGVLLLFQLFIGKWPSHSRFKIWILSKKGLWVFVYQIHSSPSL